MAKHFLLVDAHNVIFARPELAARHRRSAAAVREELVRMLERHQDAAGLRVVVVFDGTSAGAVTAKGGLSGEAGVQVFYAQAGQSADGIIERLVVKYAGTHRMTVATNDHLVRTAAVAAGAETMDVETLFAEMARAEGEMRGVLEKLRGKR